MQIPAADSFPGFAGAVIFNPLTKKVLMHHRDAKAPINPNLWGFFGGKIEVGESPTEALIRELKEEIGLEVLGQTIKPLSEYVANFPERPTHRHTFIIRTQVDKDSLALTEGAGLDWFSVEEALKLDLTKHTRQDLEYFKMNFQAWNN